MKTFKALPTTSAIANVTKSANMKVVTINKLTAKRKV